MPGALGGLNALELLLANNQLTGNIPPQLANLASLRRLVLAYNQLSGSIPSQLGNLSALTYLILTRNQLQDDPTSLGSLSQLRFLDLASNRLTGSIPAQSGQPQPATGVESVQQRPQRQRASRAVRHRYAELYGPRFQLDHPHATAFFSAKPYWEETQTVTPAQFWCHRRHRQQRLLA